MCVRVCVWVCHVVLLERFFAVDLHESLFVFLFCSRGNCMQKSSILKRRPILDSYMPTKLFHNGGNFSPRDGREAKPNVLIPLKICEKHG